MEKSIPISILDQIARHCPRAMGTYALCLSQMNENNTFVLTRNQIINDLSESYTKFKNDLRSLSKEGVLEWHSNGDYLTVIIGDNCVE